MLVKVSKRTALCANVKWGIFILRMFAGEIGTSEYTSYTLSIYKNKTIFNIAEKFIVPGDKTRNYKL